MRRVPAEVSAVERARWLAELAAALEEAQELAWQIGQTEDARSEAMELYARIEAARLEVQALRIGRCGERADFYPQWRDPSPWCGPSKDSS